jgi:hypothetical protein
MNNLYYNPKKEYKYTTNMTSAATVFWRNGSTNMLLENSKLYM